MNKMQQHLDKFKTLSKVAEEMKSIFMARHITLPEKESIIFVLTNGTIVIACMNDAENLITFYDFSNVDFGVGRSQEDLIDVVRGVMMDRDSVLILKEDDLSFMKDNIKGNQSVFFELLFKSTPILRIELK